MEYERRMRIARKILSTVLENCEKWSMSYEQEKQCVIDLVAVIEEIENME